MGGRHAIPGRIIHPGTGSGPLLVLEQPVSFWGGVDPVSGCISDPRHPQHGEALAGRILVLDRTIGSSSSSAIMLELLRNDVAPAGMVLGHTDSILILGILVARELGYPTLPVIEVADTTEIGAWRTGTVATIADGTLTAADSLDGPTQGP